MRAMILAAGRGKRMGDLTSHIPKPLVKLAGRPLIEYSLAALIKAGIQDVVINICYRGEQIKRALGDGSRFGLRLHYSEETEALETGGGIYQALPLLGDEPFIVVSGDVVTDYPLHNLPREPEKLGHLVLVDNPVFHPRGDFVLNNGAVCHGAGKRFTFANIGVYRKELFANCQPGRFRLGDIFRDAIKKEVLTGEYYQGAWHNIGRPQELMAATQANFILTHI